MTMCPKLNRSLAAVGGTVFLLAAPASANAQSDAEVFDSCKPHDWLAFSAAVEGNDMTELQRLINDPEMRICDDLAATVRVLYCEADPLACIEPAAGPDIPPPPVIEVDCPAWKPRCTDPLPPPGAHIGVENDHPDRPGPSAPAPSTPEPSGRVR